MVSIVVKGMQCNHCKASVEKTLGGIEGIDQVHVDLESGKVEYQETAPVELETLRKAIAKIGFEVVS